MIQVSVERTVRGEIAESNGEKMRNRIVDIEDCMSLRDGVTCYTHTNINDSILKTMQLDEPNLVKAVDVRFQVRNLVVLACQEFGMLTTARNELVQQRNPGIRFFGDSARPTRYARAIVELQPNQCWHQVHRLITPQPLHPLPQPHSTSVLQKLLL